jgi:hypothetical protein
MRRPLIVRVSSKRHDCCKRQTVRPRSDRIGINRQPVRHGAFATARCSPPRIPACLSITGDAGKIQYVIVSPIAVSGKLAEGPMEPVQAAPEAVPPALSRLIAGSI